MGEQQAKADAAVLAELEASLNAQGEDEEREALSKLAARMGHYQGALIDAGLEIGAAERLVEQYHARLVAPARMFTL